MVDPSRIRLEKEFKQFLKDPLSEIGCDVDLENDDLYHWKGVLQGPKDSIYKGGFFYFGIDFTKDYPNEPPKAYFSTKIFNPNIFDGENGEKNSICIGILHSNKWKKIPIEERSVKRIIYAFYNLFNEPNPDSYLNDKAADLYKNNKKEFERIAKDYVKKYALTFL